MNIEEFHAYCLSFEGVTEEFPFDEVTLVLKVYGKIFALTGLDTQPLRVNLKCDPERAEELRARYSYVLPGYHMNKRHWNTVLLDEVPDDLLYDWINHSYEEVLKKIPKSKRPPR